MFEQLLVFARDNDAKGVRRLLAAGCPPSQANRVGQSALHIAALWGGTEACAALLEGSADPNLQNMLRGSAPLHAAAMGRGPPGKRAECVKLLLQFRADLNLRDLGGELPVDCADDEALRLALGATPQVVHNAVAAKSSAELAQAIQQVQRGAVNLDLDAANPKGQTALHLAVMLQWQEGVKQLLAARACATSQGERRQTPLHAAVQRGCNSIVALLVQANADVHARDADPDHDPRFSSTTFKDQQPDGHRTPLHYAAELGNVVAAQLLLESSADVNARDAKLETPLHCCLALRRPDAALEAGGGVRILGLQARPELNGHLGAVIGPMSAGTGGPGRWPVQVVNEAPEGVLLREDNLERLATETLVLLLQSRADVNLGNHAIGESMTVLHEAARLGDEELLRHALDSGAELHRQDAKLGLTALHLAARSRRHGAARMLLEARADPATRTAGGKTAAELAATNGAPAALVALLRGEGEAAEAAAAPEAAAGLAPQTLEGLTPAQRAAFFLD